MLIVYLVFPCHGARLLADEETLYVFLLAGYSVPRELVGLSAFFKDGAVVCARITHAVSLRVRLSIRLRSHKFKVLFNCVKQCFT